MFILLQDLVDRDGNFTIFAHPLSPVPGEWPRAKLGRQSWLISHPLCGSAWGQVLTWWAEKVRLSHNAPVNRRAQFSSTQYKAQMKQLPLSPPAALNLWKPQVSGLLQHAFHIAPRLQLGRRGDGAGHYSVPCWVGASSDLGGEGIQGLFLPQLHL